MQNKIRSRFSLTVGLLLLPLLGGAARAATIPISQCGALTEPGSYHLVQDLQATTFLCLEVQANNVEIHLDGFTIHGLGQGIIAQNVSDLSITGSGTIEANVVGINALGVNGITITGVTISVSIDCVGAVLLLEGSANATLIGNTIRTYQGNGFTGGVGIWLLANDSILRANRVSGFGRGILAGGTGSLIQANTVLGNRLDLAALGGCGANTWKSNKFDTGAGCIQ